MKSQIRRTIRAHLLRVAFYLLLLLAACAIPFALAQRNVATRSKAKASPVSELPVTSTAAAAPAIACRIEYIEADPILPRTGRFQAVHAKCPLPIPRFSFPEPMHIFLVRLASFPFWEYQRIRAHPYSNRQSLSG